MPVSKRSVSFRPEVWAEVSRITGDEGGRVSALDNDALRYYLALRRGIAAAKEWEAAHGGLTPQEIAEADRLLDQAGVTVLPTPAPWQD